ncbi:hypothetical protein KKC00_00095, partial [Patescibacteria group bacterium]|nr:hypothetical protein [Patescibacteria group bacterium]
STITLEELILGLDGLCYFVVPEGTMKNRVTGQDVHLEGGHLLVSVSRGRISLEMFAGDPDTGKGFAFVRVLSRVKALRPSAYIPVKALRYWTPIPKTHEGMVPAQAEAVERTLHFFRDHPENARAATLLHALLRRTIELAFNVDSLDYARLQQQGVRVAYLEKRGSPKTDAGAPASADQ